MTEEFIKANLDGRFWWVDEFGNTRVKQVPADFIPTHKTVFGSHTMTPAMALKTRSLAPRQDRATRAIVPILCTQPATPDAAERIIAGVAFITGVSVQVIRSRAKEAKAWKARHIAYYVVRATTGLSYPSIGQIFHRDHATIQNGVWRVQTSMVEYEPELSRVMAMFGKQEAA